jgi:hypothetical protein
MKNIIRAGLVYFAFVLGAGFVLGVVRVPFLVPRIGERWAELVFGNISVYEVIDLDKQAAIEVLNKIFEDPDIERIYRDLGVVKRLR